MDIQWSLVIFTVLTGLGGWLFFFVGLNVLLGKTDKGAFAGTVAALALAIVGGCASVTHLSHPDRMLVALQHPRRASSPRPCWWACCASRSSRSS